MEKGMEAKNTWEQILWWCWWGGEGMGMTKMRIGVTLCAFLITDFLFVCFNG